ncbi:MAG: hypothetical protein HYX29_06055 [Solirubrobacterales bacterium]|nr:hypothetical protein [Solirubrobacterales bacterium]
MADRDFNQQFDAIKRQGSDLVREMHARKLAIPAAALLLALVAAVVTLPKSSPPPAAPPTAVAPIEKPKIARIAQVSLVEPSSIDEDIPLTKSADPFTGETGYNCTKASSNPRSYRCIVSDIVVLVLCNEEGGTGPCAADAGNGASGGTGAAGGDTSGGDIPGGTTVPAEPQPPSGGDGGGGSGGTKTVYYTVTVSIDGTTQKDIEAATELPKPDGALVVYAGPNDANSKGIFILADGVTADGVPVDPTFGSFALAKNQTVTLTDVNGVEHKMTLKSLDKATK